MPNLNEGDQHIVDSAVRLLEENGGVRHAREAQHARSYFKPDAWRRMADAGWLGALVDPDAGGAGLSLREALLILEECGVRAAPEPLTLALGSAAILSNIGDKAAKALLDGVIAGESICAPVIPGFYGNEADRFEVRGNAVSGVSSAVFDGHAANRFLLAANVDSEFQIWCVDRDIAGVSFDVRDTVDGGTLGYLRLNGVAHDKITKLTAGNRAQAIFDRARDIVRLGYCAVLIGGMREAFRITLEHLKLRKQFGVPIGSFQAIQHRCADLHIDIRSAHALLYEAGAAYGTERQAYAAASAKARISDIVMRVMQESVQLHGAIGYTDEHDISLYFRRSVALSAAGGDAVACFKDVSAFSRQLDVD